MSSKSWEYAQYEGIVQVMEMLGSKDLVIAGQTREQFHPTGYRAEFPGLPTIDLLEIFGPKRVIEYTSLDELWYACVALGSALIGCRAIDWHKMYMANAYPFELISQHAGKFHYMSGGQVTAPVVFVIEISGQYPGAGGQHQDYEEDTWYAHIPGVKTVIPSTVYDAKGLMISAIKSLDPIVYFNYNVFGHLVEDVPDEPYEVPIGKAAIRREGKDITIVGSGGSMPPIIEAAERLQKEGVSVEVIDLRTLHPMDTETLVKSVHKTGKLLTVDQSKYTLCPGAEVIARVAEGVPGTQFKRIAFPDAPPSSAPEMFNWMKPNADGVCGAAKMLLAGPPCQGSKAVEVSKESEF